MQTVMRKLSCNVRFANEVKTLLYTVFYRIHAPPQIDAPPTKFLDHVPEVSRPDLRVPVKAV